MKKGSEQGKQYDHEHLMHNKGEMKHGINEHHEGDGDHYKHPHKRGHMDGSHDGSIEGQNS